MRWPFPRIPALARNLPPKYSEAQPIFDERVKRKFPLGTSEARLIDELRRGGFPVDGLSDGSGLRSATVMRGIVIKNVWSVRWTARAGRIEEIFGVVGCIAP